MVTVSAIIPAYNKEKVIGSSLTEIHKELNKLKIPFEMVIVNDYSTDNTKEEIETFCSEHKEAILVSLEKNMGKGRAIISGFKQSKGDLIFFMDADTDISPSHAHQFLDYMAKFNADIVIGSKNHEDSVIRYPLIRKILSRCYQLFCYFLFSIPISDTQVGFKLYKREVLDFVVPKVLVKRFAFDLEMLILAHKKGFKIKEAPIEIKESKFSGINTVPIICMFIDTLAIWYRLNILKYYKIG